MVGENKVILCIYHNLCGNADLEAGRQACEEEFPNLGDNGISFQQFILLNIIKINAHNMSDVRS